MPQVKMPDGVVVAFPDDMPPEQIKALILSKFPDAGGQSAAADAPASPSPAAQDAFAAASAVNPMNRPAPEQPAQPANFLDVLSTFAGNAINGIPIAGPMLQSATDFVGTEIGGRLMGKDPAEWRNELADKRKALDERYQIAAATGQLTGAVAPFLGAAKVPALAASLGMEGNFGARVGNSIMSGAAISGADTAARGGDLGEVATSAGLGGGLGGLIPVVGGGLGLATRGVMNKLQPIVGAALDPATEAARRAGTAVQRDLTANPSSVLNSTDEGVAAANGVPLVNADRGGETTRALARSVANQSPEARAVLEKTASDRFAAQSTRAVDFMKRIAGGNVDDLAYQDTIRQMAKAKNRPAYDAAYNAPAARAIWTPQIQQLMQSDAFRKAASLTTSTGTDFAAVSGNKAVRNPFTFRADGSVTIKKLPDGSTPLPSLQYWDMVKRNLDGMIGTAQRAGDNTQVSLLTQMKTMLTKELDAAVPQYAKARSGAAAFFDAEDALDAGKKFAGSPRDLPEAQKAFGSMNQSEQQAFRTGFASEVIDKIKSARDRVNIISQNFGSPAQREMIETVFGPAKARELEAYVRVEDMADKLRSAVTGNSTTARQLMELGIGAGGGFALTGGDWKGLIGGAALARGARYATQNLDNAVMKELARLLTSGNSADITRAVHQATLSSKWMETLRQIERITSIGARAGTVTAAPALAGAER